MRHSKSDWSHGLPDFDRPLNDRGRRQAGEAGDWISRHVGELDTALVSSARRTRETWGLVAERLSYEPRTEFTESIYDASVAELQDVLGALPDECPSAILVGHNPGVEALVHHLTGRDVAMPTSNLVVISFAGAIRAAAAGEGQVLAAGRPPAGAS